MYNLGRFKYLRYILRLDLFSRTCQSRTSTNEDNYLCFLPTKKDPIHIYEVYFTLISGGRGLNMSTQFLVLKTINKVNFCFWSVCLCFMWCTERFIYYRKYILQITQPSQYRSTQLQYK